jgi:hypothetical protein
VIQPYAAAVGNDAYGLRATGIGLLVIERALHRREAEWAQRHLVAEQLRWARGRPAAGQELGFVPSSQNARFGTVNGHTERMTQR